MIRRTRRGPWARSAAAGIGLVVALAACASGGAAAGDEPQRTTTTPTEAGAEVSGEVVVFAAASLTDAFTEIGESFEALHPDVTVTFVFAASSALAQQILSGAPADVFATASPATMQEVVDAGAADGEPTVFVRNRLQIAVPAGNPGGVDELADLADEGLTIALCAEQVPCGAAATKAFGAAGITPAPDTLEQDARATVTKVELGEVDAALVYRTDVLAAGEAVEGIDFPEADEAVNDYPVVTLTDAADATAAQAFLDHVLSDAGREILDDAGFDLP